MMGKPTQSNNNINSYTAPPPYNPASEGAPLLNVPLAPPPSYSVAVEQDVPVSQGHHHGASAIINCRVCQCAIKYIPNNTTPLVRCPQCREVTQVGPPPRGKSYIVCQCNALLIINANQGAATCPRAHCRRTQILRPPVPGKERAFCGHCATLLTYNWSAAVVICPKCTRRSVVNRSKMIGYSAMLYIIGFIFFGVGLGITIGTYVAAENNPSGGFYFVMYGPMVFGFVILIRALIYSFYSCATVNAKYIGV